MNLSPGRTAGQLPSTLISAFGGVYPVWQMGPRMGAGTGCPLLSVAGLTPLRDSWLWWGLGTVQDSRPGIPYLQEEAGLAPERNHLRLMKNPPKEPQLQCLGAEAACKPLRAGSKHPLVS